MKKDLKIAAISINAVVGDLKHNASLILKAYEKGVAYGADLVVVNEMATTGYPPMDLLDRPAFCRAVYETNIEIAQKTGQSTLIFGSFVPNHYSHGAALLNVAIVAQEGQIVHQVEKQLLPTYDVFDEKRYFHPGQPSSPFLLHGHHIGIVICEDIWGNDNRRVYTMYDRDPVQEQVDRGAKLLISLSASPFAVGKPAYRTALVQQHAKKHGVPMIDVNQAGANTELVFDGVISAAGVDGSMQNQAQLFCAQEVYLLYGADGSLTNSPTEDSSVTVQPTLTACDEAQQFEALKCALKDYVDKTGAAKEVVLGLSGGIDSALVAVIAVEALGADRVRTVGMPSEFSSSGSIEDARLLAENLGVRFDIVPIAPLYEAYLAQLQPFFEGTDFGVAEENLQSRARGVLLMALANKFGGMVLNTGNKSEMATGYCTLYGDMNGGLSLIGDLYKTEVYKLCAWLNEVYFGEIRIPSPILTKAPSAELRPDQKDTDSLPEYALLDRILHMYIEEERNRSEIAQAIGDMALSNRICSLVDRNEYKRKQAPPVIKLHSKSFGTGRRWPIVSRNPQA